MLVLPPAPCGPYFQSRPGGLSVATRPSGIAGAPSDLVVTVLGAGSLQPSPVRQSLQRGLRVAAVGLGHVLEPIKDEHGSDSLEAKARTSGLSLNRTEANVPSTRRHVDPRLRVIYLGYGIVALSRVDE